MRAESKAKERKMVFSDPGSNGSEEVEVDELIGSLTLNQSDPVLSVTYLES